MLYDEGEILYLNVQLNMDEEDEIDAMWHQDGGGCVGKWLHTHTHIYA